MVKTPGRESPGVFFIHRSGIYVCLHIFIRRDSIKRIPMKRLNLKRLHGGGLLVAVLVGLLSIGGSREAFAFDREEFMRRMEERRAALRERLEQIHQTPGGEQPGGNTGQPNGIPVSGCTCSARLRFARPSVQWNRDMLTFTPQFDIAVNVRSDVQDERWALELAYEGDATLSSDSIAVPAPVQFSGVGSWGGQCFDTRQTFSGYSREPVSIVSISRSLFGPDDEASGVVNLRARLSGCASRELSQQFSFRVFEFGNLRVGMWRRAR